MKLYSPRECGEILSVNKATVSRMIHDRTLPAVLLRAGKKGNTYRVPAAELERFVNERSTLRVNNAPTAQGRKRA